MGLYLTNSLQTEQMQKRKNAAEWWRCKVANCKSTRYEQIIQSTKFIVTNRLDCSAVQTKMVAICDALYLLQFTVAARIVATCAVAAATRSRPSCACRPCCAPVAIDWALTHPLRSRSSLQSGKCSDLANYSFLWNAELCSTTCSKFCNWSLCVTLCDQISDPINRSIDPIKTTILNWRRALYAWNDILLSYDNARTLLKHKNERIESKKVCTMNINKAMMGDWTIDWTICSYRVDLQFATLHRHHSAAFFLFCICSVCRELVKYSPMGLYPIY